MRSKLFTILVGLFTLTALGEEPQVAVAPTNVQQPSVPTAIVAPYRTFLTIQRYTMEQSGDPSNQISNVRLELMFPNQIQIKLPGGDQFWPIGNGQIQEINQTFEVPWGFIRQDGFAFVIQMVRKGTKLLPCQFEVRELSQFNRTYTCQTDVNWQVTNHIPEERIKREQIQIRIFTDRNSPAKEIPKDSIALK